jgi:predicted NUDIX family phosphoesterase
MFSKQKEFTNKDLTQILVVPEKLLQTKLKNYLDHQHIFTTPFSVIDQLVKDNKVEFKYRGCAETNPYYKQLIPYILIKNPNGKFLSYSRGKGSGENRLHGLHTLGFGGHIDYDENKESENVIFSTIQRELKEELNLDIKDKTKLKPEIVIYMDDSEVNKVHLGLVYILELESDIEINQGETDILLDREWVDLNKIDKDKYETWSKIIVEKLS